MGEQDRAVHEISDSRARLSELATELSRRVDKEHVKEFATEKATELKVRAKDFATEKATELKVQAKEVATEKAHELKDQAKDKAIEMKDHARDVVMNRTEHLRERADTPKGWSLLGAILGASVGATLMRKAFTVREEHSDYEGDTNLYGREQYGESWRYGAYDRPYDTRTATGGSIDRSDLASPARVSDTRQGLSMSGDVGFEGRVDVQGDADMDTSASMKDKVSDVKDRAVGMKDNLKDRAHDLKDRAHDLKDRTMGRVRERVPDRGELKGKATHWFDRTLDEQPLLLALGGIAIGMVASSLLPVTRRERRLIEPAKHRVEERISELGDRLTDKIRGESDSQGSNMGASGSNAGAGDFSRDISSTDLNASDTNIGPGSTGVSEAHTSAETDLASPTGSRIPPLPPLDDMTKIH